MNQMKKPTSPAKTELLPLPTDVDAFLAEMKGMPQHVVGDSFDGPEDAPLYFGEPWVSPDSEVESILGIPVKKIKADHGNRCGVYLRGDVYAIGGSE